MSPDPKPRPLILPGKTRHLGSERKVLLGADSRIVELEAEEKARENSI